MSDRRLYSRKFWLAASAFLAGVVFFALGKLDAAQWMGLTTWVLGIYCAGNVGDQAVTKSV
ncbi:hypothetical protein IP90_00953 [Luteimonas cucumeris]|uniref:Uncharacterized protein n=1 Tax=Luteimonas cucumeris TaxID=985012 RepID=A0A562LB88_9GAMM|nr:hypothetical protein [Luteimonas cucumeris]TWI04815.1 hypothetical protein IP90_00953 [Luteimonas cucumeris]